MFTGSPRFDRSGPFLAVWTHTTMKHFGRSHRDLVVQLFPVDRLNLFGDVSHGGLPVCCFVDCETIISPSVHYVKIIIIFIIHATHVIQDSAQYMALRHNPHPPRTLHV